MQPDLRDERRAVSSGKTVSSFVRSAVHVVDSLRARLPSLFDRRVFPTTLFSFVLSSFAASVSLFPFRSRFTSCALYAPRLVSLEKSPLVSSRFRRSPPLSSSPVGCLCFINAPRCRFVLVPLQHALFRLSSFIRFHPRLVHFLDLSSSPFNHRASISASLGPSLPLSFFLRLKPSRGSLFNVTLCAVSSFSNHRSLSLFIHHPFHALPLSPFLSLAISHQLTHTLRVVKRRFRADWSCALGDAAR